MKLFSILLVVCITVGIASLTKQHNNAADKCYLAAEYTPACASADQERESSENKAFDLEATKARLGNYTAEELNNENYRLNGVFCSKIVAWLRCVIGYANDNCADLKVTSVSRFTFELFRIKQHVTNGCKEVFDANQDLY